MAETISSNRLDYDPFAMQRESFEREKMRLATLDEQVTQPMVEKMIKTVRNPNAVKHRIRDVYTKEIPQRFNQVAASYAFLHDPEVQEKLRNLRIQPDAEEELEAIIEGITMEIDMEDLDAKHRYLWIEKQKDGTGWYRLNKKAFDADRELLASLKEANPEARKELDAVENALKEGMLAHPDLPMQAWGTAIKQNPGTKNVIEMIRLPAILIGVAGTIFTGIAAFANKKSRGAAFLWAAITGGLIAYPNLFSGKNSKVLAEIDTTINNPYFKNSLSTYNLNGPAAASWMEDLMQQPQITRKFLREWNQTEDENTRNEMAAEYAADAFPGDRAMQQNLMRMIADRTLEQFANRLMDIKNTDTRDVISTYVAEDANQFDRKAQARAREMQKEQEMQAITPPEFVNNTEAMLNAA